MKHKWHKEIKAWADGAVIEWTFRGLCEWHTDTRPDWADSRCDFRIKPQPKEPKYLYVYADGDFFIRSQSPIGAPAHWQYFGKIKLEVEDD